MAALSRGRSMAIRLLGLRVRTDCLPLVSIVCCQEQVSATGRSLVQRSPTECGVSEGYMETSTRSFTLNLASDQLDAQFLYFIIRLLQSSTCFEQRRAHHHEVKFY